jgi:hypothetical protein
MENTFLAVLVSAGIALTALSTTAKAEEPPNLIGTWSGTIVGGARFGALNHDPAEKDPVFADRNKEWTLEIERQDGSGIIGTWSTSTKRERLVGAIRQDNITVILADEDNIFDGRLLSSNEMELCAQEGRTARGGATIAVCYLVKRD